jgi:hypothetical protein
MSNLFSQVYAEIAHRGAGPSSPVVILHFQSFRKTSCPNNDFFVLGEDLINPTF